MADIIQTTEISELTSTTSPASGDKLAIQKSNGETMNIDYAELARNIITQYNAQTLAGSAQSVKSALDTLNSNLTNNDILGLSQTKTKIPNGSDFDNYKTPGVYHVESDASAATMSHIPRRASGKLIVMARHSAAYLAQYYYPSTADHIRYIRTFGLNTWGDWIQETLNYVNNHNKSFSVNISSESTNTFEECGFSAYQYGAYYVIARIDGTPDGTWVGVIRHNAAGYQITDIYKGDASNTPYVDANGVLKTDSSSVVLVSLLVFPIIVWGNRLS